MTDNRFKALNTGLPVHYMHPNGTHSEATIVHIHNQEDGVVDLLVLRKDHIQDEYTARTVVYREEPTAYSWHFAEGCDVTVTNPQVASS